MAYGTRDGMEEVFGTDRIARLATFDATDGSTEISAHVATALAYADDRINAVMRMTHHRIPLVSAAGATPGLIAGIANRIAGGWLARQKRLESVPSGDAGERVLQYEREAIGELDAIASGVLRLDAK